jgi:hypothetical protein
MSNPIFQQMNPMNNIQQVLQRFKQFQQSFHGDARQQVQQLLNSGKVTQAQYDNAVKLAQQLQQLIK